VNKEFGESAQTETGDEASPRRDPRFVHESFGEQASRQPGLAAVAWSTCAELTYRELDQSVNQLAHHLHGCGVGPETLVGVGLERGSETVRCLLAILKAGGAYMPLDPSLPDIRRAEMCAEAGVRFVLVDRKDAGAFRGSRLRCLFIDELKPATAAQPTTAPAVSLRSENIAYAIYTSGSTGRPKAVAVSHGALAYLCRAVIREYQLTPADRTLQLAAIGFDTSLEQILATLLSGATLLLPGPAPIAPSDLIRYVAEERVSVLDLTPAYWHQLLAAAEHAATAGGAATAGEQLSSLRLLITGGDLASAVDCAALKRVAPRARLLSAYGLTECTITSAICDVTENVLPSRAGEPVPVGRPLAHTQILVLDEDLNPVPTGVVGEIYLAGRGVARGYLGRPAMTAERFVPNPHSAAAGTRMYRSGDLGCWRPDGNLEVIGRVDRQVKVRGFRVEPSEIERVLATHPDIGQVAAVATKRRAGDRQITAYYTRRRRAGTPGLPPDDGLRNFLSAFLPSFMIPGAFVAVERLPRTPDGRVDHEALSSPITVQAVRGEIAEPTLPQAAMSELWSQVIGVERVGPDDDFFTLGGNSMLAAEMLARTRVLFGIDASQVRPLTRCLLRDPTLRSFASAAQDARAGNLGGAAEEGVDFTREAELRVGVNLDIGTPPRWRQPADILLTGATGFFGAHLLRELLAATGARVHCLVRARDVGHAMRRITGAGERYELGDLPRDRVLPLVGDLAEPDLGLPRGAFEELARGIDVIHHAGAHVNFVYPYGALRAANVAGTREIIRLAGLYRGIPIHYISTIAVLAGLGVMGVRDVEEGTALAYAEHLSLGYVESKFVAEELLRKAARSGLPVAIYRPMDIVGAQRSGAWNTAAEMCALIRFITDTGFAPDIALPLDFVPADICAAAVRYISSHAEADGKTYHLVSPKYALLGSLTERLRKHGFAVDEVPYAEWVRELVRYTAGHTDHPMTPFVPLFVDRCAATDMTVAEMYLEHTFPSYTRTNVEAALRGSGISFPPVGDDLLDLHITRLVTTGYLRNSHARPQAAVGRRVRQRRERRV